MPKYKKRADGRYRADVTIGFSEDGRRMRKPIYGRTIKELEAKLSDIKSLQNKGVVVSDNKITLKEWAIKWLEAYKQGVSYNTKTMYCRIVKKHISTCEAASLPLVKIKAVDLQKLINEKQDQGLTRTVEMIILTLKQMFQQAVENDLLYKNPANDIKKPKFKSTPKRALLDIERKAIQNAEISGRKRAFLYLGMYAGLRRGEILALTKGDFDLEAKTVTVGKTIVFGGNAGEVQHFPKSEAGFRTIPMPTVLYDFIHKHIKTIDNDIYLFSTTAGEIFSRTAMNRMWQSIICRLNMAVAPKGGIKPITSLTPHILRHEYATSLYKAGVDIKTAQKLLGHKDIKMTLAIYTHLDQDNKDVTDKLDKLYCGQNAVKAINSSEAIKQKTPGCS